MTLRCAMNLKFPVRSKTDTNAIELGSIEVQVNPALFLGVRQ